MPKDNYRYKVGLLAEIYACVYLMIRGYRIVKWRYKIPVGEIDILAKKGGVFVVVEVKYRNNMETALYSITPNQKSRLINSAKWVMKKYKTEKIRFDAVLVSGFNISHIENAWTQ
ncbi:MAG: YraN family protein [Alphaproteobacteria bacterium]